MTTLDRYFRYGALGLDINIVSNLAHAENGNIPVCNLLLSYFNGKGIQNAIPR